MAKFIAAAHIVGPDLADGMEVMRKAHSCGWRSTLCFWEAAGRSPDAVVEEYVAELTAVKNTGDQTRVSIKPAALHHDYDQLRTVILLAKEFNIPLQFDAEHPRFAEQSLLLFERACCEYDNIGFTIPARWHRSLRDAERMIEMGKTVRVVKGQWNDPNEVHDHHIRSRYLHLTEMFKNTKNKVIVATHDKPVAVAALESLVETETPCELEQMFGLPWINGIMIDGRSIVKRMYIPYGTPYLPYNFEFVAERLEIMYWMFRDCIVRGEKKAGLLEVTSDGKTMPIIALERRA